MNDDDKKLVDLIVYKLSKGLLSVRSLQQSASRFKKLGNTERATLYQNALELFRVSTKVQKLKDQGVL